MARDICVATGERIRKLRRAISDLERGTREAGLRTLSRIASALRMTLSEMLKGV
jgi:hypothetical protein